MKTVLPDLPPAARAAWQSYDAMEATKLRHLDLLAALERKYQQAGSATTKEQALLSRLLADHDLSVTEFRHAMTSLREVDSAAHECLVAHIGALNTLLAPYQAGGAAVDPH